MDLGDRLTCGHGPNDPDAAWAASGAMALTGEATGPPLLVAPSVTGVLASVAAHAGRAAARLGGALTVDGPALLGERAALTGLTRHGRTSVGGASRLLAASDGWLAVSLARPDDIAAVAAWLELDGPAPTDPWPVVAATVATRAADAVVDRARLLGLPCSRLGEAAARQAAPAPPPLTVRRTGTAAPCRSLADVVVVDLSSLWAGPLATGLLADAGARVVKVESTTRPDGARTGNTAFFDLLNGAKESVALDFGSGAGRAALRRLVRAADVVVTASRPRVVASLGLDRPGAAPRVWLSITGHADGERVAFGDDAAVAGGLVARGPYFCADAAADPATGLLAAAAVLDRLAAGGRWAVDLTLAGTAARLAAGPPPTARWTGPVAPPRARPVRRRAPRFGADTAAVLASLDAA